MKGPPVNLQRQPVTLGIGIVYDKNGAPKLDPDFLAHLSQSHRVIVEADLKKHGWRLNADNTTEKLQ